MKKLSIALVTGGDVAERDISLLSAQTVFNHLNKEKYDPRIIDFQNGFFTDIRSNQTLDKSDFSLHLDRKITFDLVYPILHGHPAEDGVLQGYLDLLNIPYSGSSQLSSALSFNKQFCKNYLRPFGIHLANSVVLKKGDVIDLDKIVGLGFPLFIKPNQNGSSYGISRVDHKNDIIPAIEQAFKFDSEIILEAFIDGPEYSIGVFRKNGETITLPITEIIPDAGNTFFDYEAKYNNQSKEITPAPLEKKLAKDCAKQTKLVYELLECKGICRADYILQDGKFYFLEINTIPGFSPNSLVPQQAKAMDLEISELLDHVINEAIS